MGHHDDDYEWDENTRRKRVAKEAAAKAKQLNVSVLEPVEFKPIGVCGFCAGIVYFVPNWNCNETTCPHKP